MTNSVTLLPDHKGFTKPKVVGDEYVVLADCDITAYRTGTTATAASQTITAVASADTYTRGAGSYLTDGFVVGDHIVIAGSASGNNNLVSKIESVTATVITVDDGYGGSLSDNTGGGDEVITHAGEKITATSLGLSSITSVEVLSQEMHDNNFIVGEISSDDSFFYLYAYTTGSAGLLSASLQSGDIGTVRLKVYGLL